MRKKDTFGGVLREVREANGYSIDSLADRLRLRPDILRAIEDCDFGRMPPKAYSKNMVGAYARLLGLDGAELTDRYLQELEEYELSEGSFSFGEEASSVGVSMRRAHSDVSYSTRLTSQRGASGAGSEPDFFSPFRSEGGQGSASSYIPNPAASRTYGQSEYPRSSRLEDYPPRSSRYEEYPPRSSRLEDYPLRSSRYDSSSRGYEYTDYPRPRRNSTREREFIEAPSSRYANDCATGNRYGNRGYDGGYAASSSYIPANRRSSQRDMFEAEPTASRRLRDETQRGYGAHSRTISEPRSSVRGGFDEGRGAHRAQTSRHGNELARSKGLSGGGRYDSVYSHKSPLQLILSKLPLILAAILVIVLAVVLVSCIHGKNKAADDAALNSNGTPITGVDDPAESGLDTGESQQPSTQTAVPIAPTAAVFSYEVKDGKSAYIEIYIDGSNSPAVADELAGPTNGNYDVTGSLEFVTTNPDAVSCLVDGEKVKVKDKDGDGVYTYTVDFKKILKKWKEENLKDDTSSTATDASSDTSSTSTTDAAGADAQAASGTEAAAA